MPGFRNEAHRPNRGVAVRYLFIPFLAVMLSACGFQLRGSAALPAAMQHTLLSGISRYSDFGREMRRALEADGVQLVDTEEQATAELQILEDKVFKRVLSVQASGASTGKVEEYELHQRLQFRLLDPGGAVLIDTQTLEVTRDYLFDKNDPLGKSSEEAAIRDEMRRDLLQLMMLRLQAAASH